MPSHTSATFAAFAGPGEMRARCRELDWSTTALGDVDGWPQSLRTAASYTLASGFTAILLWGPELVQIYNDAYVPFLGAKHPWALGRPTHECWPEIRHVTGPVLERAMAGETVTLREQPFELRRRGPDAPADLMYITLSYAPVRDERGEVGGVLVTAFGVDDQVQARRVAREREALRAEANAERERLRSLIIHMPAPVALLLGPEHRHAVVNEEFRRISGGGRDVTGLPVREAFPELAGQGIYETLDRVYETGEPFVAPTSLVRYDRDGTGVRDTWFDVRFVPVRDAAGAVIGILNFAVDVTEQVLARTAVEATNAELQAAVGALAASEARLQASEAASRRALDELEATYRTAPVGLAVVDRELRFVRINERLAEINGLPVSAHLGRRVHEIVPDIANLVAPMLREVLDTGEPRYDVPIAAALPSAPDDVRHWIEHWLPLRDGDGVVVGISVVAEEVTERIRVDAERERLLAAEHAARADVERAADRTARLQRVTAALAAAVTTEDVAAAMLDHGLAAVGATGGVVCRLDERGEALDRVWALGYPAAGLDWFREHALEVALPPRDVVRTREPVWIESEAEWLARYLPPGAGMATAPAAAALPLLVADRLVGVMVLRMPESRPFSADDRTQCLSVASQCAQALERARLYESERDARSDAESANRAKSEFLAVMSHELRTPLNAIGGYAELIELGIHGPVTDAQRTALARVQKSQRHLLGLINGVLNYARVEAGAVHYEVEDVPLDEVMATCEALVAPQVRAKGHTLQAQGFGAGLRVRGDREKVQQIVLNLLSNAVKFTEPGGALELSCAAAGDAVRVRVADSGRGIARGQLERVFEPFVQVDARLTRTQEGTGLGLAISRDLARGMGGELTVESAEGRGSVFTLVLPRAAGGD